MMTVSRLGAGGLASLAIAGAGAVVLGVPLAVAEGRAQRDAALPLDRFLAGVERMWAPMWVGSVAALALPERAPVWIGAVAAFALLLPVAGRRFPALPLALAVLAGLSGIAQALYSGAPWTLLEPAWDAGSSWSAASFAQGFALAAAGLGAWPHQFSAPGTRRAPWFTVGASLFTGVAAAAGLAASFEHGGRLSVAAPLAIAAGFAAIGAPPERAPLRPSRWENAGFPRATAMMFATLWFATLGFSSLDWWFSSFLIAGPVAAAVRVARSTPGNRRWIYAGIACAAAALAVVAWPGAPPTMGTALGIAALVVVPVWVAGTPALTRSPSDRQHRTVPSHPPPESAR